MSSTTLEQAPRPFVVRSPRQEAWRRFRQSRLAMAFLGLFGVFLLMAITAQVLELTQIHDGDRRGLLYDTSLAKQGIEVAPGVPWPEEATPPSTTHWQAWLGTDSHGKSVLLRVFHGTKIAFVVGTFGALLSVLIGMTLGLMAGYFGRWVDEAVVYVYTTVASIPYLLLILALAFLIRQGGIAKAYAELTILGFQPEAYMSLGLFTIVLVIGLTSWVTLCRLVRAEVKKVRELDYVQAARALGFGDVRIMFKHVLPNVFHLVIINFSLTFVTAIKSEVILTFLGVGVDKEPSWGQMISAAKSELMKGIWWPILASGSMLFLLTLAVNYVGDALRDALDPKLKR
ncbi:MAG: ABC transporter permease [Planctomycetota bacterium]